MTFRISPLMWPLVALAAPVLVPKFLWRNRTFKANRDWAVAANRQGKGLVVATGCGHPTVEVILEMVTPRTAMLAVIVSVILAILGTVMAVYLIVISP